MCCNAVYCGVLNGSMSSQKYSKINQILKMSVPGTVLTSSWLHEQGVSRDLARKYVSSGWLERVGQGAYKRADDPVDWQGGLYALQSQLKLKVHVAGISALRLRGLGHYLSMNADESVLLFGDDMKQPPVWFREMDWGVDVTYRCVRLFNASNEFPPGPLEHKAFHIGVSSAERAAFELLHCVGSNAAFDFAQTMFEGLGSLRPNAVQALLLACRSVKVKRLFLWMARTCGHLWLKHIDTTDVDLGSGKRVIYKGGELDRDFLITVPRRKENADV